MISHSIPNDDIAALYAFYVSFYNEGHKEYFTKTEKERTDFIKSSLTNHLKGKDIDLYVQYFVRIFKQLQSLDPQLQREKIGADQFGTDLLTWIQIKEKRESRATSVSKEKEAEIKKEVPDVKAPSLEPITLDTDTPSKSVPQMVDIIKRSITDDDIDALYAFYVSFYEKDREDHTEYFKKNLQKRTDFIKDSLTAHLKEKDIDPVLYVPYFVKQFDQLKSQLDPTRKQKKIEKITFKEHLLYSIQIEEKMESRATNASKGKSKPPLTDTSKLKTSPKQRVTQLFKKLALNPVAPPKEKIPPIPVSPLSLLETKTLEEEKELSSSNLITIPLNDFLENYISTALPEFTTVTTDEGKAEIKPWDYVSYNPRKMNEILDSRQFKKDSHRTSFLFGEKSKEAETQYDYIPPDVGADLHILSKEPESKDLTPYQGKYLLIEKNLFYVPVNETKMIGVTPLADLDIFLNPIKSKKITQIHLTKDDLTKLIAPPIPSPSLDASYNPELYCQAILEGRHDVVLIEEEKIEIDATQLEKLSKTTDPHSPVLIKKGDNYFIYGFMDGQWQRNALSLTVEEKKDFDTIFTKSSNPKPIVLSRFDSFLTSTVKEAIKKQHAPNRINLSDLTSKELRALITFSIVAGDGIVVQSGTVGGYTEALFNYAWTNRAHMLLLKSDEKPLHIERCRVKRLENGKLELSTTLQAKVVSPLVIDGSDMVLLKDADTPIISLSRSWLVEETGDSFKLAPNPEELRIDESVWKEIIIPRAEEKLTQKELSPLDYYAVIPCIHDHEFRAKFIDKLATLPMSSYKSGLEGVEIYYRGKEKEWKKFKEDLNIAVMTHLQSDVNDVENINEIKAIEKERGRLAAETTKKIGKLSKKPKSTNPTAMIGELQKNLKALELLITKFTYHNNLISKINPPQDADFLAKFNSNNEHLDTLRVLHNNANNDLRQLEESIKKAQKKTKEKSFFVKKISTLIRKNNPLPNEKKPVAIEPATKKAEIKKEIPDAKAPIEPIKNDKTQDLLPRSVDTVSRDTLTEDEKPRFDTLLKSLDTTTHSNPVTEADASVISEDKKPEESSTLARLQKAIQTLIPNKDSLENFREFCNGNAEIFHDADLHSALFKAILEKSGEWAHFYLKKCDNIEVLKKLETILTPEFEKYKDYLDPINAAISMLSNTEGMITKVNKNYAGALEHFHTAAERNHPEAMWQYIELVTTTPELALKDMDKRNVGKYLEILATLKPHADRARLRLMEYYAGTTDGEPYGITKNTEKLLEMAKPIENSDNQHADTLKSQLPASEVKILVNNPLNLEAPRILPAVPTNPDVKPAPVDLKKEAESTVPANPSNPDKASPIRKKSEFVAQGQNLNGRTAHVYKEIDTENTYVMKHQKAFNGEIIETTTNEQIAEEKLAYDLYSLCGVTVPEHFLVEEKTESPLGEKAVKLHIASKIEPGFKTLWDWVFPKENGDPLKTLRSAARREKRGLVFSSQMLNEKPIKGLFENLAVFSWLYDWDGIGSLFDNGGLIEKDGCYHYVKIDPGCTSLVSRSPEEKPLSQIEGIFDPSLEKFVIRDFGFDSNVSKSWRFQEVFAHVPPEQKLVGIRKIASLTDKQISDIINQEDLIKYISQERREAIITELIARREKINICFKEQLAPLKEEKELPLPLEPSPAALVKDSVIRENKDPKIPSKPADLKKEAENIKSEENYYKILGIEKNATNAQIKKAYLEKMMLYHPDKRGALSEEESQEEKIICQKIVAAYECLSDTEKRKSYDLTGSSGGNVTFFDFSTFDFSTIITSNLRGNDRIDVRQYLRHHFSHDQDNWWGIWDLQFDDDIFKLINVKESVLDAIKRKFTEAGLSNIEINETFDESTKTYSYSLKINDPSLRVEETILEKATAWKKLYPYEEKSYSAIPAQLAFEEGLQIMSEYNKFIDVYRINYSLSIEVAHLFKSAAEKNHPEAMHDVFRRSCGDPSLSKDDLIQLGEFLLKAAKLGHVESQYNLLRYYMDGGREHLGFQPDKIEAQKYAQLIKNNKASLPEEKAEDFDNRYKELYSLGIENYPIKSNDYVKKDTETNAGMVEIQGKRNDQEDQLKVTVLDEFEKLPLELQDITLKETMAEIQNTYGRLEDCFEGLDKNKRAQYSGSTACVATAWLDGNQLHATAANLGDSTAFIVITDEKGTFVDTKPLYTFLHRPAVPQEYKRIMEENCDIYLMPLGDTSIKNSDKTHLHLYKENNKLFYYIDGTRHDHVFEESDKDGPLFFETLFNNIELHKNGVLKNESLGSEKGHCLGLLQKTVKKGHTLPRRFVDQERVNGKLAVSRSIGDPTLLTQPDDHIPNIFHFDQELAPGQKAFIVVACDGLTDKNAVTQEKIGQLVAQHHNSPTDAAHSLVKTAYENGSKDNISVAVVPILKKQPVSAAVFDGHGGAKVSKNLGDNFYAALKKNVAKKNEQVKALSITDPAVLEQKEYNPSTSPPIPDRVKTLKKEIESLTDLANFEGYIINQGSYANNHFFHPEIFKSIAQKGQSWMDQYLGAITKALTSKEHIEEARSDYIVILKTLELACKTLVISSSLKDHCTQKIKETLISASIAEGYALCGNDKHQDALNHFSDAAERGSTQAMVEYVSLILKKRPTHTGGTEPLVKADSDQIAHYTRYLEKLATLSDNYKIYLAEHYLKGNRQYEIDPDIAKGLETLYAINAANLKDRTKPLYNSLLATFPLPEKTIKINPDDNLEESESKRSIPNGTLLAQRSNPALNLSFSVMSENATPDIDLEQIDPHLQTFATLSNHYAHWSRLAEGSWGELAKREQIIHNCTVLYHELQSNPSYTELDGHHDILKSLQETLKNLHEGPKSVYLFCGRHTSSGTADMAEHLKSLQNDKEINLSHLEPYVLCSTGIPPSAFVQGVHTANNTFVSETYIAANTLHDRDKLRPFIFDQLESFHADSRNAGQQLTFSGNFSKEYLIEAISYCRLRGYDYQIEDSLQTKTGFNEANIPPDNENTWRQWLTTNDKYPFHKLLSSEAQKQQEEVLQLKPITEEQRAAIQLTMSHASADSRSTLTTTITKRDDIIISTPHKRVFTLQGPDVVEENENITELKPFEPPTPIPGS